MIYPIGTTFRKVGHPDQTVWTVIDVLTTTNSSGEIVRIRHVAEKPYQGHFLRDDDIVATTIARGLVVATQA